MRIWTERRDTSEVNHELIWASIGTLALLAAMVWPLLPMEGYPCMFLKVTGKPCLSCGMTRGFECAVRGEFLTAWRWNPAGLVLFAGTLLYTPYAWTVLLFGLPPVHVRLTRRWEGIAVRVLLLAAVIANWVYVWNSGMPY